MMTLLLVRPEARSRELAAALAARGVRPRFIVSPVMEIRAREVTLPENVELILTSQNAVASLPAGSWRAWCVGDRTAEAARAAGLDAVSAGGDVGDLLPLLLEVRPRSLIHVRGEHATGDLAGRLVAAGIAAREVVAYDQVPLPLTAEAAEALAKTGVVVLPLYSPRSAALVAGDAGPWRAEVRAVAISEAAARAFDRPAHVSLAPVPSGEAMERAIVDALGAANGARLVDRGGAG